MTIRDAGFEIEYYDRMFFKPYPFAVATARHVIGVAQRRLESE